MWNETSTVVDVPTASSASTDFTCCTARSMMPFGTPICSRAALPNASPAGERSSSGEDGGGRTCTRVSVTARQPGGRSKPSVSVVITSVVLQPSTSQRMRRLT